MYPALLESSWNVMAHGDAREGKWRGNWRMEWVASTLHTTSEHGVSSINTADAHTSAASSRLNWRPRRFKWTRPFLRKTKSGFCACAIIFQLASAFVDQVKRLLAVIYWRFEDVRHKIHCTHHFKKPIVKWRKGLLHRSLSLKACEQPKKGNEMCLAETWKTRSVHNVTCKVGQKPETNKHSTQHEKERNKKTFSYWPREFEAGGQVKELCERGCSYWGHLE